MTPVNKVELKLEISRDVLDKIEHLKFVEQIEDYSFENVIAFLTDSYYNQGAKDE
jgi:hypothetical protein